MRNLCFRENSAITSECPTEPQHVANTTQPSDLCLSKGNNFADFPLQNP